MTKNNNRKAGYKKSAAQKALANRTKGMKRSQYAPRYNVPQMMGAPAGVSQDLQQFTKFRPTQNGEGICISTCAAIFAILKTSSHATVGTALIDPNGLTAVSTQMSLTDPARLTNAGTKSSVDMITPIFDLIASAFVKYKVKKLIFHYEPQASATDGERLVFAFAADPLHPVLWNSTVPDGDGLLALADSIAFMPWRAWSMDVSHKLTGEELFTYSDASTSVTEFVERFSDFGVISCVTDSVNGSSNERCGVLYMETEIELLEFCPISVTRPSSLLRLGDKVGRHAAKRGDRVQSIPEWDTEESADLPEPKSPTRTNSPSIEEKIEELRRQITKRDIVT